jgi:hypothetical protein
VAEPGARPRHCHIEWRFRHDGAVARWSEVFFRRRPSLAHSRPAGLNRIGKKPRGINQVKKYILYNTGIFN